MNIKKTNSILLLLFIFFAACEEAVVLDTGYEERLAVNCQFSPGTPFNVYVSKTLDPLSNEENEFPDYLKNARVAIYKGESLWCELPYQEAEVYPSDRYLKEDCLAEAEVEYTIRVSAPGFEEVFATDIIPPKTEIQAFEISDLEIQFDSDTVASFQFNVKLILEETQVDENYYLLDFNYEWIPFQVVGSDTITERTGTYFPLAMESLDGNPPVLKHFEEKKGGVLFTRAARAPLELNFQVTTPSPVSLTMDLFEQVYANLRTVSKDYYLYHLQLSRQEMQKDIFFLTPVILADNIQNGFGLFAGFQLTRDSVSVDDQ